MRGRFKNYFSNYSKGGNVNEGKIESFTMASLRQVQIRLVYMIAKIRVSVYEHVEVSCWIYERFNLDRLKKMNAMQNLAFTRLI